jgi:importin subunit alpha-2
LKNLCNDNKSAAECSKIEPALPVLAVLINNQDEEIIADACWSLSYLTNNPNGIIQEIIELNVCGRLVELLKHSSFEVVQPVLRVVGNIVTGDDAQTQVILDCNVSCCLLKLFDSSKESIRKEACWTISNIAAGNRDQLQVIWLNDLFSKYI